MVIDDLACFLGVKETFDAMIHLIDHCDFLLAATHNAVVLDALNLNDDNQRLFVVRPRLRLQRVFKKEPLTRESIKMLQTFLRGYIGGI